MSGVLYTYHTYTQVHLAMILRGHDYPAMNGEIITPTLEAGNGINDSVARLLFGY